jgi:hypothetical protein
VTQSNEDAVSRTAGVPQGDETPSQGPITPPRPSQSANRDQFCTCGHEPPEHRHGRCWIGWDGQPVAYKPSLIACPCTGWEPTP